MRCEISFECTLRLKYDYYYVVGKKVSHVVVALMPVTFHHLRFISVCEHTFMWLCVCERSPRCRTLQCAIVYSLQYFVNILHGSVLPRPFLLRIMSQPRHTCTVRIYMCVFLYAQHTLCTHTFFNSRHTLQCIHFVHISICALDIVYKSIDGRHVQCINVVFMCTSYLVYTYVFLYALHTCTLLTCCNYTHHTLHARCNYPNHM